MSKVNRTFNVTSKYKTYDGGSFRSVTLYGKIRVDIPVFFLDRELQTYSYDRWREKVKFRKMKQFNFNPFTLT